MDASLTEGPDVQEFCRARIAYGDDAAALVSRTDPCAEMQRFEGQQTRPPLRPFGSSAANGQSLEWFFRRPPSSAYGRISTRVNSPTNDDADLLTPVPPDSSNTAEQGPNSV